MAAQEVIRSVEGVTKVYGSGETAVTALVDASLARRGHEVMELLRQKALGMDKAVVIVSHDHRIRDVADRVFWLEDGRLQSES